MKKNQSGKIAQLSLVGTPIGNLQDITLRAIEVIQNADILLCEDTRRTGILLQALKIKREGPIKSFHDHTDRRFLEEIRQSWQEGKTVAYVSDAGMPSVADPGYVLVDEARKSGIEVSVVPGPSAVTAFFAGSGIASPKFLFHGFFPRSKGEVEKVLAMVKEIPVAHIFYEAPSRMGATLDVFHRNLPEYQVSIGRELTKMYEEFLQGGSDELRNELESEDRMRGEFVFGVMGAQHLKEAPAAKSEAKKLKQQLSEDPFAIPIIEKPELNFTKDQQDQLIAALKSGIGSKEVAKRFSREYGISRRVLYDYIVKYLT